MFFWYEELTLKKNSRGLKYFFRSLRVYNTYCKQSLEHGKTMKIKNFFLYQNQEK